MEKFLHIHRNRGQNSHGYSKSRMGWFNGSFYIFPLSRSVGTKWTLEVLLIAIIIKLYQPVSIVLVF